MKMKTNNAKLSEKELTDVRGGASPSEGIIDIRCVVQGCSWLYRGSSGDRAAAEAARKEHTDATGHTVFCYGGSIETRA